MKIKFTKAELEDILTRYAKARFNLVGTNPSILFTDVNGGSYHSVSYVDLNLNDLQETTPNTVMDRVVEDERKLTPEL